jgi:soluble lytic murein transglycosylase
MLKRRKNRVSLSAGAGLCALLIGIPLLLAMQSGSWLGQWINWSQSDQQRFLIAPKSAVLPLVSLSPTQRTLQLQAIAQLPKSQDRVRARYLLASDLIEQQQGEKALRVMDGLEQNYSVLAPYIALKRAQAYDLTGDKAKAQVAWQDLLKRYPDHPVAAEALFVLGSNQPKYWKQAIAQFPTHPRTLEIVRSLLKRNPNQPQLLLLLAKHAYDQPGIISVLDQLVSQYAAQLKPEDWEVVAFAYWENQVYPLAGAAYAEAPRTPLNIYRTAYGFQLDEKRLQAIAAYQQLLHNFPDAKETGTALLQLANMANQKDALTYLDQVIRRFPNQAGEALVEKAEIFDTLQSNKSAAEARQLLLTRYGDSEAAAQYRWKVALAKAAATDYQGAWQWAQPIPIRNPKSILAPRAGFWIGKWAIQMGRQRDGKAAFEYVLSQFPYSYYAWRSAAILGLDVGNFNTLRQLTPEMVVPARSVLPAGSATLKELYQLGQDRDAWTLWQVEFQNYMQPTVAEQFTDGLMHLARGENLVGIAKVSTLEDRETPAEQAEYKALSKQMVYWQARYPFPFLKEIKTWSQERQLNPLLVTALIRQESHFEPKVRSVAGAIGLMQVMPGTSKWVAEKINMQQYNTENPDDNIQLGTWFLDYTHRQYNNNSMLAVASYNAGPGNVSKWLSTLGKSDPDEFVEAIPFGETQGYVRQVFGNYWNYLRLYNPEISQLVARYSTRAPKPPLK